MHCSPPGSSVHEISQARILERVNISFSRGSSQPRDRTLVSCIGGWVLYHGATWEASLISKFLISVLPVVCIELCLLTISGLWPCTAWVCFHLAGSRGPSRFCSSLLAFGEHFWTTHDELATGSTALLCIPIIPTAPSPCLSTLDQELPRLGTRSQSPLGLLLNVWWTLNIHWKDWCWS